MRKLFLMTFGRMFVLGTCVNMRKKHPLSHRTSISHVQLKQINEQINNKIRVVKRLDNLKESVVQMSFSHMMDGPLNRQFGKELIVFCLSACLFVTQAPILYTRLAQNLLGSPGWPGVHRHPHASGPTVLGLEEWTNMPIFHWSLKNLSLSFWFKPRYLSVPCVL